MARALAPVRRRRLRGEGEGASGSIDGRSGDARAHWRGRATISVVVEVGAWPAGGACVVPVKTMARVNLQIKRRLSCFSVGG